MAGEFIFVQSEFVLMCILINHKDNCCSFEVSNIKTPCTGFMTARKSSSKQQRVSMWVYCVAVSHWFNGRLASTIFFAPNFKVVVAGTVGGSGPDLLLITLFLQRSILYLDCSDLYFCNLFIHKPLCMPCFFLQFSYSHTHTYPPTPQI